MPSSPAAHDSPPAPSPHRRRKRLLFFVVATAGLLALLLWPRPEMASEHFTEGRYRSVTHPLLHPTFAFHDGLVESRYEADFPVAIDMPYKLDGTTVRTVSGNFPTERTWHYRTFDGVALLLTPDALAIFERDGGLRPAHQEDMRLWRGILVCTDNRYRSTWPRLVREHPRFAAALPPWVRNSAKVPWLTSLRDRWRDFLIDHPKLRARLPGALRGY